LRRFFAIEPSTLYDGDWVLNEFENFDREVDIAPLPPVVSQELVMPNAQRRAELLAQSGISEYGWQVAIDFLCDFDSLLTPVWRENHFFGSFHRWANIDDWRWVMTYERQRVEISFIDGSGAAEFQPEQKGFFDGQGNLIEEAPWMYTQRHEWENHLGELVVSYSFNYADYFSLFDFDGSGIPDIIMHFRQTFEGDYGGFNSIFRYIDGEYVMLDMDSFYTDGTDRQWVHFGSSHDLSLLLPFEELGAEMLVYLIHDRNFR